MTHERTVTVGRVDGLHARPATELVRAARSHRLDRATVEGPGGEVDARSIVMVIAMGARQGDTLTFRAAGDDAEAALDAMCRVVQ